MSMRKTIVVYRSEYGYTKRYAEMIAEELHCEIQEGSNITIDDLKKYDTIIWGGGLYAGGLNGIELLRDSFESLQGKNIVVWATGFSPGRSSEMQKVWRHNFTDSMLAQIHTFYLRGGFDYQRLSVGHKIMMNGLKLKIKMTKNPGEDERRLLKAYRIPEDHCDKNNLSGLVEYVRSL